MKKANKLLLFLFLAITGTVQTHAQTVTTRWGDINKSKSNRDVVGIVGRDESGYYVVTNRTGSRKDKINIEKYDNDHNQLFSNELVLETPDGKTMKFEHIFMIDHQLILFSSFYDKKADKNFAFATRINGNGTLDGKTKIVDEIAAEKRSNSGSFHFSASADSSKILVYHDEPYEKKENERFSLKVYDKDLELKWDRSAVLPYKDKDISIKNYTIANNDVVYILAKYQEGKKDKKGGKPNYNFVVLAYEDNDEDPEEFKVDLGNYFITDAAFELDKKNNLIFAGFFSKNNAADAGGTFYVRIDGKSKDVLQKSIKEFGKNNLSKFMNERRARKGKELSGYDIRRLIPLEDGGSVLLAEQYYVVEVQTTTKSGVTVTNYYYHYNDVIAVHIDRAGEIGWMTRIPKYQISRNDGGYYSSFATCVIKDKICLVYNDNKKNVENYGDKKRLKAMTNVKKSLVMLVSIDAQGNYAKAPLMSNKDSKIYIRPKMHLQVAQNDIIMYGRKGKKFMFGNIQFD